MTEAEVLEAVRRAVERAGSQSAFARLAGVQQSNVSATLSGRIPPSPAILRAVGIERRVVYRRAS